MTFRALLTAALLLAPSMALADPCTAPVRGFSPGEKFVGTVRYVGDGDGLCVGPTSDPRTWIEVRLVNWFAPELSEPGGREAKNALEGQTKGRAAVCTVRRGHDGKTWSYDRVIASCAVDGRDIGRLMGAAGVTQGGRGYSAR